MPAPLVVLICLTIGSSTLAIGAFPALLPEIGRSIRLTDVELGALAAAFGFARMAVDLPVGLLVARRLGGALVAAPLLMTAGIVAMVSGGPFGVLLAGRIVMGAAHGLGMVAWLTATLRYQGGHALGAALNAIEFTAVIGILAGNTLVGTLPRAWTWNAALALACAPQVLGIALAPLVVRAVRRREAAMPPPLPVAPAAHPAAAGGVTPAVVLAFATGATLAIAYSAFELHTIPLRGSREFGLDRSGVARLLMVHQLTDVCALLPVGLLADRVGPTRMLVGVTAAIGGATALVAFGGLGLVTLGAALFGLGMAGWMLPLALLRRETPPARIAWRTALYRVGVDAGCFLGPFVAGLLGARAWMLSAVAAAALGGLAVTLAGRAAREAARVSPGAAAPRPS